MKKSLLLFIFSFFQICIFAQNIEHYLKIQMNGSSDLDTLTRMVSIAKVVENEVIAFANDEEFENLTLSTFIFEELEHPSTQTRAITMATTVEQMANWDRYPTYSVYNQLMAKFVEDFPNLCKLDTIGTSIQNRNMLAINVTADIHTPKPKPEVLFSSTMHGNETTGWILCMRLAHYLMSNYGADPRITSMLDSVSIFIAPNTNPDGTYWGSNDNIAGARRNNAGNKDLNRNFPDPRVGEYPDGARQKETTIMMDYASARNFILSINYHGGTEVVNYPWDTWKSSVRKHADHNWYIQISSQYANLAKANGPAGYFTNIHYSGITNGGDWLVIAGGRQDYMNYWQNCREVTLEVSMAYILGTENLQAFWNYKKEAMLGYIENVKYGIRGLVTGVCEEPIAAKITVVGHDKDNSQVVTNHQFGNYYRMIEPGTYTLLFESEGYQSKTITNVTAQQNKTTLLNVTLLSLQEPIPYVEPQIVYFETKTNMGDTTIKIMNKGGNSLNFAASIENAENNSWLSLSNNSGALCINEKSDIILSYNFASLPNALYEANVLIDVGDSIITVPVSIVFMGAENEIGIPYVTPKEIVLETHEFTGDCVVNMKNIGNKAFDYYLDLEPESCDAWLSLSHHLGTLEPEDSVEIVLSYDFTPFSKGREDYMAELNISVNDTVIQIPVKISLLLNLLSYETEEIKVYPNPTTGELRIINYELRIMKVEVFDVYGRMQKSRKAEKQKEEWMLDISELSAGIYFIKMETTEGTVIRKAIKN